MGRKHPLFDRGGGKCYHIAMKELVFLLTLVAVYAVSADALPFWGDLEPATNRVAAASAVSSPSRPFESRRYAVQKKAVAVFTSKKRIGARIIIR